MKTIIGPVEGTPKTVHNGLQVLVPRMAIDLPRAACVLPHTARNKLPI